MSKTPKRKPNLPQPTASSPSRVDFDEVLRLIDAARARAFSAVNKELIDLYWQVGEYISRKLASTAWGEGVVQQLADHIAQTHPDLKGFTRRNLFRMRQFYETYVGDEKVSPLVTQLPWTHNLLILSRSKRAEEREFYLRMALRERWSFRELQRQLHGALFERTVLAPPKLSTLLTELHPEFQPAHLGQLEFYLEALDRDVKKPHEGPSIGVLLCATKDSKVVEYALSRSVSPALVAEYQTRLPDKKLLQAKLHEFYELAQGEAALSAIEDRKTAKPQRSRKK
jgi:predicted nuclease of restriction endonuclease-like (RecB) superfamily